MFCRFVQFSFLLQNLILFVIISKALGHSIDNVERESDGAYRPRDYDHYGDSGHNADFDHEAILGSVKEAEEFDKLSPEEAKQRLALLLPKMDLNGDKLIDRDELKKWILNSFSKLSIEEAEERMQEADDNRDGVVTWPEYLQDSFGVDSEEEIGPEDTGDTGMLLQDEKVMWAAADSDGDGKLDLKQFAMFSSPEEHEAMHGYIVKQALRDKDKNNDGYIDLQEYLGERGEQSDKEWYLSEKDKFEHELDRDGDGRLDAKEIHAWVIPDNDEIAEEEVEHLFSSADGDGDGALSFAEILDNHRVFAGSEADYDPLGDRADDEL